MIRATCATACAYCSGAHPKFRPVIVDLTRSSAELNSPSKCKNCGPECDCIEPTICIAFLGVISIPLMRRGIGLCSTKSAYVRFRTLSTFVNSVTKWQERQLIDSPANGPGNIPTGVLT